MTKSFLLLILTLITACKVSSDRPKESVKGCRGGWVDFTCSYPKCQRSYEAVDLKFKGSEKRTLSGKKDEWTNHSRFSLYHNTTAKALRVIIRNLQDDDIGEYKCEFKKTRGDDKVKWKVNLKFAKDVCKEPVSETVNTAAETTITCEYPDGYGSDKTFFCKESSPICEDVSSNQMFTLQETDRQLEVSITEVSSQHQGVYWCGLKSKNQSFGFRKIIIEATSTSTSVSTSTSLSVSTSVSSSSSTSTPTPLTTAPSNQTEGGSQLKVIIPAVVCAAVLVFLLLLVLFCKWTERSKHTTNGEAHNQKEEQAYEEIQERPQKPASGTALKTIYTTANFPTIPSAPQEYSSITFTNHSADANNDTYSTVKDADLGPAPSAVNPSFGLSEDPFYSTLSPPQE